MRPIAHRHPQGRTASRLETLIESALSRRYAVEFQPVVDFNDNLLAWRARARFHDAGGQRLATSEVFAALHRQPSLLASVELDLKGIAIGQAPAEGKLLVSLDADSYAAAGRGGKHGNAFDRLFRNRSRLVVEICENRAATDTHRLIRLLRALAGRKIPVAVGGSTPAFVCIGDMLVETDWLRLPCPADLHDGRTLQRLASIAEASATSGIVACVSGVRDADSLPLLRSLGFAGLCGPLFPSVNTRQDAGSGLIPATSVRQAAGACA